MKLKKLILGFAIISLVLMGISSQAMADTSSSDFKYVIVNTTQTTLPTAISTDIIDPIKHRILRFKVSQGNTIGGSTATEVVAALYDSSTFAGAGNKQLEGEIESNDSDSVEERYSVPLRLANGCVIMQGANTIVLVEWEKVR